PRSKPSAEERRERELSCPRLFYATSSYAMFKSFWDEHEARLKGEHRELLLELIARGEERWSLEAEESRE
ncbi:hypothetical protein, partial [Limimaricola cinnabarinus]|uniref:hypothetical protein n=1 Tax=Limimaricola cinnabarinus TaxID=1125964 RepID=UPI0024939F9E